MRAIYGVHEADVSSTSAVAPVTCQVVTSSVESGIRKSLPASSWVSSNRLSTKCSAFSATVAAGGGGGGGGGGPLRERPAVLWGTTAVAGSLRGGRGDGGRR